MSATPPHFSSDQHALAAGAIFGAIILEQRKPGSMIDVAVVDLDTDENYKPMLTVEAFGRQYRVIVAEIE